MPSALTIKSDLPYQYTCETYWMQSLLWDNPFRFAICDDFPFFRTLSRKIDEYGPFLDDQMMICLIKVVIFPFLPWVVTGWARTGPQSIVQASAQLQPGGPRETRALLAARRQGKQLGRVFCADQHGHDPNISTNMISRKYIDIYLQISLNIYESM